MRFTVLAAILGLGLAALPAQAKPSASANDQQPMEITADGLNRYDNGIATAEDNVIVRYRGDVIYADRVVYNSRSRVAMATGNVRIFTGDRFYRGQKMIYNFDTKAVQSADFRMSDYPAFTAGQDVTTPGANHYRVKNGTFTTDNRQNPAWRIKAKTVEIYPDDRVVLKNAVVYAGNVPIFWVPYYAQSLKDDRQVYDFQVGSSGRFGTFMLNEVNWFSGDKIKGTVHMDVREKRGFAGGVDLKLRPNADGEAFFRGYVAQDNLYSSPGPVLEKYMYPGVTDDSRYVFEYRQNMFVAPDLSILADVHKWSDPFVTADFFEREFRLERVPDNVVEATYYNPQFLFSVLGRAQINPFFENTERLPEIKFEVPRIKLWGSPIAYEGESSLATLDKEFADGSPFPDYTSYRYDTLHQLLYPKQYFGWLNITPRAGFRATYWSDDNRVIGDVDGMGDSIKDERGRLLFFAGLESSFKLSKTWLNAQSKSWGVDGLRHVAEPFVNIQYVPTPSTRPNDLLGFDDRLPSTRLQPINFPEWNSIDSIDRQFVVRHGVRNKLQTKRDGVNTDLVDWALYADLNLLESQLVDNTYSNVYSDLLIDPLPWLSFASRTAWDVTGNSFTEIQNELGWQVNRAVKFSFGQRSLRDSVLFPDSDLYTLGFLWRFNESWQFRSFFQFEADTGQLEEQSYTLYRDLTAWQFSATFKRRKVTLGDTENIFYIALTLKAFPSTTLGTDLN